MRGVAEDPKQNVKRLVEYGRTIQYAVITDLQVLGEHQRILSVPRPTCGRRPDAANRHQLRLCDEN